MFNCVVEALRALCKCYGKDDVTSPVRPRVTTPVSLRYLTIVVESDKPINLYRVGIDMVHRFQVQHKGGTRPRWRYRGEYGCFDEGAYIEARRALNQLKRPGLIKLRIETQEYRIA